MTGFDIGFCPTAMYLTIRQKTMTMQYSKHFIQRTIDYKNS